jgi:hypothetical protein
MAWRLSRFAARIELARKLRDKGFYIRWHAYEFLLGYRGRLVGTLFLEPSKGRATLYCRRGAPLTEIERALREALSEVAGGVELEVNEVG